MIETVPLEKAADACIAFVFTEGIHRVVCEFTDELTDLLEIIRPCDDGDASSIHSGEFQTANNH